MEINIEELKEWNRNSKRGIYREIDSLKERQEQFCDYAKATDVIDALISKYDDLKEELDRKQEEIDDLSEQLEQKDQVIADLRQQLLEAQNMQLESEKQQLQTEKQHLETEVSRKPTEIHNHFEPGSRAQVFNDKVNGKFTRNQKVKKDKKDKKKRWKKIARKIL